VNEAGARRYRITHHTTYDYDDEVTDSYGLVFSRPRDLPGQQVREHALWTDPGHADLGEHRDSEGNVATYFHVTEPHRRLTVSAVSVVDCVAQPVPDEATGLAWEDARPEARRDRPDAALAWEYAVASPLVELVDDAARYAATSLTPGRPLVEAVLEVVGRMHREFDYRPGSTTVTTRVREVYRTHRGVCQDFAHALIAGLRAHGLAARYVSGYLETDPPPGGERLVGADATHAWVQVWMPGSGWLSVDPTNDGTTGERHVTVAWGRDYADVPPVKGVIFTEAETSSMTVTVDVAPVG
jgi:transglutaminase-like putative cysteine protease